MYGAAACKAWSRLFKMRGPTGGIGCMTRPGSLRNEGMCLECEAWQGSLMRMGGVIGISRWSDQQRPNLTAVHL